MAAYHSERFVRGLKLLEQLVHEREELVLLGDLSLHLAPVVSLLPLVQFVLAVGSLTQVVHVRVVGVLAPTP